MKEIELSERHLLALSNLGLSVFLLVAGLGLEPGRANTMILSAALLTLVQGVYHYNKSEEVSFSVSE